MQLRTIKAPPLVRGFVGLIEKPPTSKRPVAACQYMYQPIRRTKVVRRVDPQAPKPTSHEKMANFGPRRKKGGKPPKADKRHRKARLKTRLYLGG